MSETILAPNPDVAAIAGDLLPYSLAYLTGSHGYGLNTPDSDQDWTVIYYDAVDQRRIFKLHPEVKHSDKNDHKLYSLAKFAALIAKGNPNVVELAAHLRPDRYATEAPTSDFLHPRLARGTILSFMGKVYPYLVTQQLAAAYIGHLVSMQKEIQTKGVTAKRLSHALRMADCADVLLLSRAVPDYRAMPGRQTALDIKLGRIAAADALHLVQSMTDDLLPFYQQVKDQLPGDGQLKEVINDFFIDHR